MSANDKQIQGDHYRKHGDHQPWDVLRSWLTPEEYRGWMKGNAIVYLARERDKGGDQDIAKAAHHLEKLGEVLAANSHQPAPDSHQRQATIAPLPPICRAAAPSCATCRHADRAECPPGCVRLSKWEAA